MKLPLRLNDSAVWLRFLLTMRQRKYLIATSIFVIWVAFIDSNNLLDRLDAMSEMRRLEKTKRFYQKKVEEDSHLLNELKSNNEVLERYAREKYLMKREDEDIFIIVEK